jgi:diadenosine tetraphosphate (Ap4A) HIT family hydrolase
MTHDIGRPATAEEIVRILRDTAYDHLVITQNRHWTLYLNGRDQSFPGRAYAWMNQRHVDRTSLTHLGSEERYDLLEMYAKYEYAIAQLYAVATVNFEWLGNETDQHRGHGHAHFIPRFYGQVFLHDRAFMDENPMGRRNNARLRLERDELIRIVTDVRSLMQGRTRSAA